MQSVEPRYFRTEERALGSEATLQHFLVAEWHGELVDGLQSRGAGVRHQFAGAAAASR